jgi:hypothetical protein
MDYDKYLSNVSVNRYNNPIRHLVMIRHKWLGLYLHTKVGTYEAWRKNMKIITLTDPLISAFRIKSVHT